MATILDCGHVPSAHDSFTTGYGTTQDGRTQCYACCAQLDRDQILSGQPITAYYAFPAGTEARVNRYGELRRHAYRPSLAGETREQDARVTNWPGTFLGTIVSATVYRHNFGSRMVAIRARMFNGAIYTGRASFDNGSVINLRPAK